MKIPTNAEIIIDTLNLNGFSAFVVGGCVRDIIMGRVPKDWDIATSAKPEQVKKLFKRTYDTGILHGTVTVLINNKHFEVTTYRIDGEYEDHRRPSSVIFTGDLIEDLKRRDFTMNAIAYHPTEGFIDPFNGIEDIKSKIIRGVGDPNIRFNEDALRMLRAIRFSSILNFTIEKNTENAIIKNCGLIKNMSAERIKDEVSKIMCSGNMNVIFSETGYSLFEWICSGLSDYLKQYKVRLLSIVNNKYNLLPIQIVLLFSFQDTGKLEQFLKKLKYDRKTMSLSLNLHKIKDEKIENNPSVIKQHIREWKEELFENYLKYKEIINYNDIELKMYYQEVSKSYRKILEEKQPVFLSDLEINGTDLMNLGITEGEEIGVVLNKLLSVIHNEPEKNQKEILLKLSQQMMIRNMGTNSSLKRW